MSFDKITAYKCTRADGTDFRTGKFDYSKIGATLEEPNADVSNTDSCGRGLHVSPTAHKTCRFGNQQIDRGKWRWFEVSIDKDDLIAQDHEKLRVKRLTVVREVPRTELFGEDFDKRVAEVRADMKTWKDIPWLKPTRNVTDAELAPLLTQWYESLIPHHSAHGPYKNVTMPRVARRVAAAVAAVAWRLFGYYSYRWYTRPYYVLRRAARWKIAGLTGPNPWAPLVELYKMGCVPIGYAKIDGEVAFTVYCPRVTEAR